MDTKYIDHYEYLKLSGEYGTFQKIVNAMFCMTIFPSMFPLLIMYFSCNTPPWRCKPDSSICITNGTFDGTNVTRCFIPRSEWEYTRPAGYSLVTQYQIDCDNKWLAELLHSVLFFGFIFGAIIIGWFADNYGRKIVHYVSMSFVLTLSFLCIFSPNVYIFVLNRFLIGIFMHGTFPQIFVMISEIVGNNQRVFANTIIIIFATVGLTALALKSYFITQWKVLYIACSLPYLYVIPFCLFVPQSIRFLSVKGQHKKAEKVFTRIAKWNKRTIPSNYSLSPTVSKVGQSSPLDLFRTRSMLSRSLIQGYAFLILSMTFYSLYLAAGNISGHMYRDFIIVTAVDIPVLFVTNLSLQKFGRKKTSCVLVLFGSSACILLGLIVDKKKFEILKVALAIVGKCFTGGIIAALNIWSVELYPTYIRGQGLAFLQVMDKTGSTISVWIVNELTKVNKGLPFFLVGSLSFVTIFLLRFLPEMNGKSITDGISEADNEHEEEVKKTKTRWRFAKYSKREIEPVQK